MTRQFYIFKCSTPSDGVVIPGVSTKALTSIKSYHFSEGIPLLQRLTDANELPLTLDYSPLFDDRNVLYDFVDNSGRLIILSPKARAVLETVGITNIEYLPAKIFDQNGREVTDTYFVANVLGTEPFIDVEKSDLVSSAIIKHEFSDVDNLVVDYDRINPDARLFRIHRMPTKYVVDQVVVDAFKAAGLIGYGLWKADGWRGTYV